MDMSKLVRNMEEYVQSFRRELDKHDGSGMSALADNAKTTLSSLKDSVLENSAAKNAADKLRGYMEKFEEALKKGDRRLSSKALTLMEEALRELRKRQDDKGGERK